MTSPSVFPPPPLTRWGIAWRNLLALAVGGLLWVSIVEAQVDKNPYLFWLDLFGGIAAFVAMNLRRRWPVQATIVAQVLTAFSSLAIGAAVVAFVSLATRRRWSEIIPASLVSLVASQLYAEIEPQTDPDAWWLTLGSGLVFTAVAVAVGGYIGARRELLASLQDRAERAEREQSLRVAQAQAHERTRIAREMHDVLAHRMSLVAMHAGALAYRDNLTPDETRQAAEVIQANSHRALTDLREILGVLRDNADEDAPTRPQPTLCDLDELINDERTAGAKVTLHLDLADEPRVPDSIGRTAYRMIQESLTNARKHAPSTSVDVRVSGAPGIGLTLEVRNPLRVGAPVTPLVEPGMTGGGFGLIGLAERAALAQGRFEHGRTREGDFVVRAWLPWSA